MSVTVQVILVASAIYLGSLLLHPYTKCGTCKGTGMHWGGLFSYASRPCHACNGRGLQQRWGAALFGIATPTRRGRKIQSRPFGGRR